MLPVFIVFQKLFWNELEFANYYYYCYYYVHVSHLEVTIIQLHSFSSSFSFSGVHSLKFLASSFSKNTVIFLFFSYHQTDPSPLKILFYRHFYSLWVPPWSRFVSIRVWTSFTHELVFLYSPGTCNLVCYPFQFNSF